MVHVPVEHEHPLRAQLRDGEGGGERDVVEQAEPHRPVGFGVVAGGAHAAEPQRRLAGHQRAGHLTRAAGGVQRGAVGGLADERVGVDRAAPGQRELPDPLDVTGAVHELQLRLLGGRGGAPLPAQPVARGQRALDLLQALGRVGMLGHVRPRIVLQARRVAEVEARVRGPRGAYVQASSDCMTRNGIASQSAMGVSTGAFRRAAT